MKVFKCMTVLAVIALIAVSANAGFIVEPHESGEGFANFTGTPRYSTGLSTAVGVTATMSAYGSTGAFPDVYEFSYTPGTDVDNTDIDAGIDLGNGILSSGMAGGGSGLYNVYITWCYSDNVSALTDITVTNDADDVVLLGVDMDAAAGADVVESDGMNVWKLVAEGVMLTEGNTYTVTQAATADTWTSMRSSGVLWEAVPEPATMLLLGVGALVIRRKR